VIVNDVDTDRLRRAADLIRAAGADVTMPPKDVADWLDHVAIFAEHSKLGDWIPGLQLAGLVAGTVVGGRGAINEDSGLVQHARRELALAGEDSDVIDWYLRTVTAFASFGHSGGSAACAIPVLERLLRHEPLTDLTDDPAEWIDRTEMSGYLLWQNLRGSRAMSTDGGVTYWLIDERDAAGGDLATTPLHTAAKSGKR
jgi:hypothetical protein